MSEILDSIIETSVVMLVLLALLAVAAPLLACAIMVAAR
jgi:hypothetical protein